MYCNECGTPNPDNGKFCSNCGATLTGQRQSVESQQPVNQQPVYQQPQVSGSNNSTNGSTTGSKRVVPPALIVIGGLIMLFTALGMFIGTFGGIDLVIIVALCVAGGYLKKVDEAASGEESEKAVRKFIIALAIAAILFVLKWIILISAFTVY